MYCKNDDTLNLITHYLMLRYTNNFNNTDCSIENIKKVIHILFDFKKAGDWGQALYCSQFNNMYNNQKKDCIFITRDFLAALRGILCKNVSVLFTHNHKLVLFKKIDNTIHPANTLIIHGGNPNKRKQSPIIESHISLNTQRRKKLKKENQKDLIITFNNFVLNNILNFSLFRYKFLKYIDHNNEILPINLINKTFYYRFLLILIICLFIIHLRHNLINNDCNPDFIILLDNVENIIGNNIDLYILFQDFENLEIKFNNYFDFLNNICNNMDPHYNCNITTIIKEYITLINSSFGYDFFIYLKEDNVINSIYLEKAKLIIEKTLLFFKKKILLNCYYPNSYIYYTSPYEDEKQITHLQSKYQDFYVEFYRYFLQIYLIMTINFIYKNGENISKIETKYKDFITRINSIFSIESIEIDENDENGQTINEPFDIETYTSVPEEMNNAEYDKDYDNDDEDSSSTDYSENKYKILIEHLLIILKKKMYHIDNIIIDLDRTQLIIKINIYKLFNSNIDNNDLIKILSHYNLLPSHISIPLNDDNNRILDINISSSEPILIDIPFSVIYRRLTKLIEEIEIYINLIKKNTTLTTSDSTTLETILRNDELKSILKTDLKLYPELIKYIDDNPKYFLYTLVKRKYDIFTILYDFLFKDFFIKENFIDNNIKQILISNEIISLRDIQQIKELLLQSKYNTSETHRIENINQIHKDTIFSLDFYKQFNEDDIKSKKLLIFIIKLFNIYITFNNNFKKLKDHINQIFDISDIDNNITDDIFPIEKIDNLIIAIIIKYIIYLRKNTFDINPKIDNGIIDYLIHFYYQ